MLHHFVKASNITPSLGHRFSFLGAQQGVPEHPKGKPFGRTNHLGGVHLEVENITREVPKKSTAGVGSAQLDCVPGIHISVSHSAFSNRP